MLDEIGLINDHWSMWSITSYYQVTDCTLVN